MGAMSSPEMPRRAFMAIIAGGLLAAPLAAEAQSERKIVRVGVLMVGAPSAARTYVQGFEQGLHELGYREGEHFTVAYRYLEGTVDDFRTAATEFVRAQVDVIVAWGTSAATGAQQATRAIPIIAVAVGDPVETGLISSLTRPGGMLGQGWPEEWLVDLRAREKAGVEACMHSGKPMWLCL